MILSTTNNIDGNPVKVDDVMYRFKYEMEEDD